MKICAAALGFATSLAAGAQAESLCGRDDVDDLRAVLAGDWAYAGAASFVTASLDNRSDIEGAARIEPDGTVLVDEVTYVIMPLVRPELGDVIHDVDAVDDILDTVAAEWIADAVSATPCGPEQVPQLSAPYSFTDDLNGQLTLLAYATDQVVLILEAEYRGDWGIAFVTLAALFNPE